MAPSHTENQLIKTIGGCFPHRKGGQLRLGVGDDAAVFRPRKDHETILTCDWFLEGTHFLRDRHPADSVGWKCLARAVSDIAAMGGEPRCFLLSLALPAEALGKWLNEFLGGLRRAALKLDCELAGGDTTQREEILIGVTVVGEIQEGMAVQRAGARPEDQIYVTGTLGDAEVGLRQLRATKGVAKAKNRALQKHLYPMPQLEVGWWLATKKMASAMMDLSDGLSTDLARLCAASGVGARIEAESLPVSLLARREQRLQLALHGGEDYELLFTARRGLAGKIPQEYRGVALTRIGEITRGQQIVLTEDGKARALVSGGWDPFRAGLEKLRRRR